MGSVNISITEDAYRYLRSLKGSDKSFSDVILDIKHKQKGVLRFFGMLKDVDWKAREQAMKSLRDSFEGRL